LSERDPLSWQKEEGGSSSGLKGKVFNPRNYSKRKGKLINFSILESWGREKRGEKIRAA